MKKFLENNWQILTIECLIILAFIIFFGQFGDLMVDSYREIYIPKQVANGKSLYSDIFTIYAPFSYLFNALVLKIFTNCVIALKFAGLFTTMGIFYLIYKISNLFLDKKYSLGICLFTIAGLVLSPNVFNPFFPYSYGIIYGLLFILLSIYFALKEKFPLSYIFYSLAICSKYEFLLLLPLLIFWSKKKDLYKNIIALLAPIAIICGLLWVLGTSFSDIIATAEIILTMSGAKTLNWFYSISGLVFRWEIIPIYITNFIKFLIPFGLIFLIKKIFNFYRNENNGNISHTFWIFTAFSIIIICCILWGTIYQTILIYLFPLVLLLLIIKFKKLNRLEVFFIIACLLISAKVFFALALQSYGTYFIAFGLIPLFILTPNRYKNILLATILTWTLTIGIQNGVALAKKDMNVLAPVVEYIKSNTKETDKVVTFPECLGVNILANRSSDNKFYSLIPLYVETFGENLIIKRLEITKPEYIVISNYDTSAYYYSEFGKDYALKINEWINRNYTLEKNIISGWDFAIYKN